MITAVDYDDIQVKTVFQNGRWRLEVSQEPSLGFEPTSLRFSESAVQHSTHRATRVLRWRGRQSLTRRLPHYSPFFISEWSLSALALHRCPPWPPIVARLDPRSWPALTLTPRAWSAFALNRGPPWLPIVVRLGPRFWTALTFYGRPLRNSKQD